MATSRKAWVAFAGVFLIGAAVGALVVWSLQDVRVTKFMTYTTDPKSMAARINQKYVQEYHLTPDEQSRIAPLTQEMTQRLYVIRRQFGVDIIQTMDDYHEKISQQMSPDHRAAYKAVNDARKKWMTSVLLPEPAAGTAGK
jgi:LmbE family N-acetylglucosaminyl deacetylase